MGERKRRDDSGLGWYERFNRALLPFMGPAQVGIGRPEAPYEPPADPVCPICGSLMALHTVSRSDDPGRPALLGCPRPGGPDRPRR